MSGGRASRDKGNRTERAIGPPEMRWLCRDGDDR
jgi:hypothetical protein